MRCFHRIFRSESQMVRIDGTGEEWHASPHPARHAYSLAKALPLFPNSTFHSPASEMLCACKPRLTSPRQAIRIVSSLTYYRISFRVKIAYKDIINLMFTAANIQNCGNITAIYQRNCCVSYRKIWILHQNIPLMQTFILL